jgi:hypothetical protein
VVVEVDVQDDGDLRPQRLQAPIRLVALVTADAMDEFELAGVTKAAARIVRAPYVDESPVHLECVLTQIIELPTPDPTDPNTVTTVDTQGGNDILTVGNAGNSLDQIQGPLHISGGANRATPDTTVNVTCVGTTIIVKMGKARYAWITLLPLSWLAVVTMSAGIACA